MDFKKYQKKWAQKNPDKPGFFIKIENINTVNDYEQIKDLLFGIIGLNNIKVNKFSNNTLFCEINFYGELETLLIEIVENTYLNLLNTTDLGDNISIEYKLWADTLYLFQIFYQS